ncbi:MAG: di-heme-cytochrome C peroxidase [Gammaproteobacteria bacterium]|nr:di-heme-cytochrome C peroxidase [Gammaproteobacteria bacterium]MDH5730558.1 di-heme-cytochrome C peroxidase [Gammaproteobacteria bacterium]
MNVKIISFAAGVCLLSACISTPDEPDITNAVWLDQGWSDDQRQWFHHESQGTATLPVPYEWFVEIEQPINIEHWYKGAEKNKFSSTEYLQKFGYIPSVKTTSNPDALAVGFVRTAGMTDAVNGGTYNAIGMTCAGCHTGHLTYKGTSIRVDGGPAVTEITTMIGALGISLVETDVDLIRRERFKNAVIKRMRDENPTTPVSDLETRFENTYKAIIKGLAEQAIIVARTKKASVDEGFTRLDALNRIGNTVFGAYNPVNIVATTAPVNYPHIWTTSWFDWVQYDGSIMQPMIRNAGESMGVAAALNLKPGADQFASSVKVKNLFAMESLLAGTHPQKAKAFNGLKAPKWPEKILGKIDQSKASKGKVLYEKHCQSCHLPTTNSQEFWSDKYWKKITPNGENYLALNIIPTSVIGTDTAQSEILVNRTVDISGMDMSGTVCGEPNGKPIQVTSSKNTPFAFALGLAVEQVVKHYYIQEKIDPKEQALMNGGRPNCLQAPKAYKARPLNGIWATGPFLHNGSVANLYEMLLPAGQRAATLYLGFQEFDPKKVGFISTPSDGLENTKGLSKVIVSGPEARKGNFNSGHEFSDNKGGQGVIGPLLKDDERWALVEFLKTL